MAPHSGLRPLANGNPIEKKEREKMNKSFSHLTIYYRDENKIMRKIPNLKLIKLIDSKGGDLVKVMHWITEEELRIQ